MSYLALHRSHHGACSPEACGSLVWACRDPQAATNGQAATNAHTPDRYRAAYPPELGQTRVGPPGTRPALALGTLLGCPTNPPSPVDVATRGRANDALAWHRAGTPLTATPSGGRATTWSVGTAVVAGTRRAHTGHGARKGIPGPRPTGPQGRHGVCAPHPTRHPTTTGCQRNASAPGAGAGDGA
jgi:hypothetical protein